MAIGAGVFVATNSGSPTDVNLDEQPNVPELPNDCSVEALPVPEGAAGSRVTGTSTNGEFIVGNYEIRVSEERLEEHPIIWRDGEMTDTVDFPNDLSHFGDINSGGLAIGTLALPASEDTIQSRALVYEDGDSTELEDELSSYGLGVNDHGDMVGSIDHPETNVSQAAQFFEGDNELLDVPDENVFSEAMDIDDDGNIVGYVDEWDFGYPYRWGADGEGEELTLSEAEDYTLNFVAYAVNNGVVLGSARDSDENQIAAVWESDETEGTVIDLDMARDLNAGGWIVGGVDQVAAAYVDGEVFELPRLDDASETEDRAEGVSEDGSVIAGNANFDNEDIDFPGEAVIWSCE